MAKKSMVARENRRIKTIENKRSTREQLKGLIKKSTDFAERMAAQAKLQKLPRDASPARHNRRCSQCGRPHAVYRKFGLCRICLRQALMWGFVPGGRKASW